MSYKSIAPTLQFPLAKFLRKKLLASCRLVNWKGGTCAALFLGASGSGNTRPKKAGYGSPVLAFVESQHMQKKKNTQPAWPT